jgi:hypothetical protein
MYFWVGDATAPLLVAVTAAPDAPRVCIDATSALELAPLIFASGALGRNCALSALGAMAKTCAAASAWQYTNLASIAPAKTEMRPATMVWLKMLFDLSLTGNSLWRCSHGRLHLRGVLPGRQTTVETRARI